MCECTAKLLFSVASRVVTSNTYNIALNFLFRSPNDRLRIIFYRAKTLPETIFASFSSLFPSSSLRRPDARFFERQSLAHSVSHNGRVRPSTARAFSSKNGIVLYVLRRALLQEPTKFLETSISPLSFACSDIFSCYNMDPCRCKT